MPQEGIHSVTIPGGVDGWAKMHMRYGKLPWKDLFQSAIAYAENGFPVSEAIQQSWSDPANRPRVKANAEATRVFFATGKPPQEGDLFRNPGMARAFRLLADQGPDAFYKGEIGAAILKTSHNLGGTMTAEDLAAFCQSGYNRFPSIIEAGVFTNCLQTGRVWRRSKC